MSRVPSSLRHSGTQRSKRGVLGVGVDLVELTEFEASVVRRPANLRRIFTAREVAACKGPSRLARLAARFAAKEAAFKAVGTGWARGVTWHDAEVVSQRNRAPHLVVRGALRKHASAAGGTAFEVSLTHSGSYAAAIVMLVGP